MNVVAEGFQRGDINDLRFIGKRLRSRGANQTIEADEKGGERFTGAGGGGNEGIASGGDFRPAQELGVGWRQKMLGEPFLNQWIEAGTRHCGGSLYRMTQWREWFWRL